MDFETVDSGKSQVFNRVDQDEYELLWGKMKIIEISILNVDKLKQITKSRSSDRWGYHACLQIWDMAV